MKYLIYLLTSLVILVLISCTPYFISSNFESRTLDHKTIAVLPFKMVFLGKMPEQLTEEDVLLIEEAESKAFQNGFYNEILRSTKRGNKPIRIDVQHYDKTLNLLSDQDISIRDSWTLSPENLATVLGVDAVVRAKIEKTRFMSDLESYGIELGTEVINILTNYQLVPWLPVSSINKDVTADYGLFDKKDGMTLWSITFNIQANWRQPANLIIDEINRRAGKKFPYREKAR